MLHADRIPPILLRTLACLVAVTALLAGSLTASSSADLQSRISSTRSAAADLRSEIAADSSQIAATTGGLRAAQDRLAAIQTQLDVRIGQLRSVQASLLRARDRLVDLENQLRVASIALATNLRASYEGSQPDLMTVILESRGFGDLLNQMSFMARVAHLDTRIVGLTRTDRAAVSRQATSLEGLEARDRRLATEVLTQRNQAAALQSALLHRQLIELGARSHVSARFQTLSDRLKTLEKQAAEQAARAAATGNAAVGGLAIDTGGMVQAPAGAPPAVAQVIAAANAIATLPYIYGGGHASFHADGYDCSGSISYALAAAGLVSAPMVSGDFESWGAPGPGRWITVYANAGHVWMEVAGWRFDTVALAQSGTRWSRGGGELSGFVVRHPPGL